MAQEVYIPKEIMDWIRNSAIIVEEGNASYLVMPFVIKEVRIDHRLSRKEVLRLDDIPDRVKEEFKKIKI